VSEYTAFDVHGVPIFPGERVRVALLKDEHLVEYRTTRVRTVLEEQVTFPVITMVEGARSYRYYWLSGYTPRARWVVWSEAFPEYVTVPPNVTVSGRARRG